ncbi:hypothetical protein AGMMS50262_05870 [Bacteroidia bacterium]|nr:hypothetical protein AGMMS50262_05870 [Bacteroidia bacterium]
MSKLSLNLFLAIIVVSFTACKQNKKEDYARKIVTEWMGRTVQLPDNILPSVLNEGTVSSVLFQTPYKILVYTDSTGCTNCKLKLSVWKNLIQEIDSLMPNKLSILFYFHPKNEQELSYLFRRENFDYPVFIDMENQIDQLNHFPSQMEYQCFLLDKDNKVVLIGNPTLNPKVWELYKTQISGEKQEQQPVTTVQPDKWTYDYGTIRKGSKNAVVFSIENTGDRPLVISQVSASCGCTNVSWDKQLIEKGQRAKITAEMTPEETGHFNKTIEVFGNMEASPLKLTISGRVIE